LSSFNLFKFLIYFRGSFSDQFFPYTRNKPLIVLACDTHIIANYNHFHSSKRHFDEGVIKDIIIMASPSAPKRLLKLISQSLTILTLAAVILAADDDASAAAPPLQKPAYSEPTLVRPGIVFAEPFSSADALKRFIPSAASKDGVEGDLAKYDGRWEVAAPEAEALEGDLALIMRDKAKHHAIAAKLDKPFLPADGKPLVFQYEVKFQAEMTCGGAYVKLLSADAESDFTKFHDKTPYTIMFGPDRCGTEEKLHFILRHVHPVTDAVEEKHAKKPSDFGAKHFEVGKTRLYRLVIHPDSSFEVSVDKQVLRKGHLLSDMEPSIVPEEMIDDPEDFKPEDWDEREKIEDPEAKKPEDWDEDAPAKIVDEDAVMPEGWLVDEETMIPDPSAEKPSDWDDEMDGDWEAPLLENPACKDAPGCGPWTKPTIDNPEFKGKWRAPLISNPAYKGIWKPQKIKNPDYFEEPNPIERLTPIGAIGLELWTMSENVVFDNFILAEDLESVDKFTAETWDLKAPLEATASPSGESVFGALLRIANENPVMWAVYVIVALLPILLIYLLCCRGGDDTEEESAATSEAMAAEAAARRKKTDEPTKDDEELSPDLPEEEFVPSEEDEVSGGEEEEEEGDEGEVEDVGGSGDGPAATKAGEDAPKKSSLDG